MASVSSKEDRVDSTSPDNKTFLSGVVEGMSCKLKVPIFTLRLGVIFDVFVKYLI